MKTFLLLCMLVSLNLLSSCDGSDSSGMMNGGRPDDRHVYFNNQMSRAVSVAVNDESRLLGPGMSTDFPVTASRHRIHMDTGGQRYDLMADMYPAMHSLRYTLRPDGTWFMGGS